MELQGDGSAKSEEDASMDVTIHEMLGKLLHFENMGRGRIRFVDMLLIFQITIQVAVIPVSSDVLGSYLMRVECYRV